MYDICVLDNDNQRDINMTTTFDCSQCGVKFATKNCLIIHSTIIHDKKINGSKSTRSVRKKYKRTSSPEELVCDVSNIKKDELQGYKENENSDENYLSETCNSEGDISENVEEAKKYACSDCESIFSKKTHLLKHLKEIHDKTEKRHRRKRTEIVAEHFCDVCNKGFTRKYDMQKHRKSKHPDEPSRIENDVSQLHQKNLEILERCKVPSSDNKTYYKCETCNKIFRQSYNFWRHQSIHTGARPFFCHICGKNFRVSGGLHRHITEHHYGVKKYPCDICGKKFAAKASRDDHRNIHTNNRPFVCDMCGKTFKQKASLHIHKLFHFEVYKHVCSICGKKYRRACELKLHTYLHTGHKPHRCDMCGSMFRLKQDLKRHLKVHDKLNECICNECGTTFSQERYLMNHLKTHQIKQNELIKTDIDL